MTLLAETLDFRQRLERRTVRMVLLDGGADGGEQVGLDAPFGLLCHFEQLFTGVALDDEVHRGLAIEGKEALDLTLVNLLAVLFEQEESRVDGATGPQLRIRNVQARTLAENLADLPARC